MLQNIVKIQDEMLNFIKFKKNQLDQIYILTLKFILQQYQNSVQKEKSVSYKQMLIIRIQSIIFQPKFPCSISIIAKIQNQQFKILEQMTLNQIISQKRSLFPLQSTVSLINCQKARNNKLNLELNLFLTTSSGRVKLASIKKNLNQISRVRQSEQQRFLNCPDKNAKLVYSLTLNSFNFNINNKFQLETNNNNNKIKQKSQFKTNTSQQKQNSHRFQSSKYKIKQKNDNLILQAFRSKKSLINRNSSWLSPQLASFRSLQTKRQESNQSKKTSRLSRVHNQQYKQKYIQINYKMDLIQRKFIKSQQKVYNFQQEARQLLRNKSNIQEVNKKLQKQNKQQRQLLDQDKKQLKKLKSSMAQIERQIHRKLQTQFNQKNKLQYRESLLREKLKGVSQRLYQYQHDMQNALEELKKYKDQSIKTNNLLAELQKKLQEQTKTNKKQIKIIKSKHENQFQKSKEELSKRNKNNIELSNQLKRCNQTIQTLQRQINNYQESSLKENKLLTDSQKQLTIVLKQLQGSKKQNLIVREQSNKLKDVQKSLKNSLDKVQEKLQKVQKSLAGQIKKITKDFQVKIVQKNQQLQEKQQKLQELNKQILKLTDQNKKMKVQIEDYKQKIQTFDSKNQKNLQKQSNKLQQIEAEKMIKFNLAQLSEYERVQQQNAQLQKQIKKLQKSIGQLNDTAVLQDKTKVPSQTQIRITNLKQSLNSGQNKQKLMRLSQINTLNQKVKEFQTQKNMIIQKYQQNEKQILQKNKQLDLRCKKMSKMISQNNNRLQDKQLIIVSFKTNLLKGLKHIEDVDQLITKIEKNQKISPNTFLSLRQNVKKLEGILSKIPKGVEMQENQLPMIKLSKPKSKKQSPQKQRQQSGLNKSQLFLRPQREIDNSAMNRSQVLLNINKSIFLNDSFQSNCDQSCLNSQQKQQYKINVMNVLQG